jgi:hypothetical protein
LVALIHKVAGEQRRLMEEERQIETAARPPLPPCPIGYGNPPPEHRFCKGQSGNPKGRPRRRRRSGAVPESHALNFAHQPANLLLLKEAYRHVPVRDGDRTVRLPAIQAVYRSIAVEAMNGNRQSQAMWAQLVQQIENADREGRAAYFQAMIDYKTRWENAIDEARGRGWPEPTPLPHPDDIHVDLHTPRATITGPKTAEEKAELDAVIEELDMLGEQMVAAADAFRVASAPEEQEACLAVWRERKGWFDRINDALPVRYRRVWEDGMEEEEDVSADGQ